MTKSLCFTIGVPIIVRLVVSVPLLKAVIQITVEPVELRHNVQVERHLSIFIGCVLVALTNRVQHSVGVIMDNPVTQIVVGFLPVVLRNV